jgi:hypothetical protein
MYVIFIAAFYLQLRADETPGRSIRAALQPGSSPLVYDGNLALNIHDLGVVARDLLYDLLGGLPHEVIVVVHHNDLGFGDTLNILDLQMIYKEFFMVSFG